MEAVKTRATPVTTAHAHTLDQAIRRIDEFLDGVFDRLERWRPRLQRKLDEALQFGSFTGADLANLIESDVHEILGEPLRPLYGAGFCASENVVSAGNPLAWWQGPDHAPLASSTFGPVQTAIDMDRFEWYRVPRSSGRRHVAGPFVDYLCSNQITVTMSVPVEIHGRFSGVMCADILVSALEDLVLPDLIRLQGAVVVNSSGRVTVSTNADYETGDLVTHWQDTLAVSEGRVGAVQSNRHPFAILLP